MFKYWHSSWEFFRRLACTRSHEHFNAPIWTKALRNAISCTTIRRIRRHQTLPCDKQDVSKGSKIKAAATIPYPLFSAGFPSVFLSPSENPVYPAVRRIQCGERTESIPRTFGRQTIITESSVPRSPLQENTDAIPSVAAHPQREDSRFYFFRKRKTMLVETPVRWCMCTIHPLWAAVPARLVLLLYY